MHRHFTLIARIAIATLLAGFVLFFAVPGAQAQGQDANKQIGDLVAEISILSKQVCGVTAPTDADAKKLYDERQQILLDDAKKLITLLDQQKPTGSGILDKRSADDIASWEKSLTVDPNNPKSCPVVPSDLQKYATGAAPEASPTPQVTVTTINDFGAQTIGTTSDPQSVTVTNNSAGQLDVWVWYGTHLNNFKVTDNSCDTWVQPKDNCRFKVSFAPTERKYPEERLRVVKRRDWEPYEQVREAQVAVDAGASQVNTLRKAKSADAQDAMNFCSAPPKKTTDDLLKACKSLNRATKQRSAAVMNFNTYFKLKTAIEDNNGAADLAANVLKDQALAVIPLSGKAIHWKYPLTRGVVGIDVSAVSSQTVKQAYFVDFDLLAPLNLRPGETKDQDALENRLWVWLNPRITSLPQSTNFSSLATISDTGSFFTPFSSQKNIGDIAQGFDISGGLDIALIKPRDGIPWWGEYVNTKARLAPSFIFGAGVSTPFSVDQTDVISGITQGICDAFSANSHLKAGTAPATVSGPGGLVCTFPSPTASAPTPTSPVLVVPDPRDPTKMANDQFIDFVTPERSRFFRRYYAGLRLKTYFFSPDVRGDCKTERKECEAPYDLFPGIIDLTLGQDESVTKGGFNGLLLRLEGVYPLPFYSGLHIFGSVFTSLTGDHLDQPFNSFSPVAANGANTDFNTFRFATPLLKRDYFRIGIGVDLIQVFKHGKGGQPTTTTATPSNQSGASTTTSSGSSATSPNQ